MQDEYAYVICDLIFGHVEIKQELRFEDGKMVCFAYSIRYDKDGKELSRSEPEPISSIVW